MRNAPPDGTRVRYLGSMPGVPRATVLTLRHRSPTGNDNGDVVWLEADTPLRWSHATFQGFWAARSEYEVVA